MNDFYNYRRSKLTLLLKDCFETSTNNSKLVFISHVSPLASNIKHIRNTLEYTKQLLEVEYLKKQIETNKVKKAKIKLPTEWSKKVFTNWLSKLDNGRFVKIVDYMQMSVRPLLQ